MNCSFQTGVTDHSPDKRNDPSRPPVRDDLRNRIFDRSKLDAAEHQRRLAFRSYPTCRTCRQ